MFKIQPLGKSVMEKQPKIYVILFHLIVCSDIKPKLLDDCKLIRACVCVFLIYEPTQSQNFGVLLCSTKCTRFDIAAKR